MSRPPSPSSAAGRPGSRGLRIGAATAVFLVAFAALQLLWASRGWPLVHDAPIMHYVAWRILEGATPYRDLFDMNFPGVYAAHLLRASHSRTWGSGLPRCSTWRCWASPRPVSGRRCAPPGRRAARRRQRSSASTTSRAAHGSPDSASSCSVPSWPGARRARSPGPARRRRTRPRLLGGTAVALGRRCGSSPTPRCWFRSSRGGCGPGVRRRCAAGRSSPSGPGWPSRAWRS